MTEAKPLSEIIEIIRAQLLPAVRLGQSRLVPGPGGEIVEADGFLELSMHHPRQHTYFEGFWLVDGQAHMKLGAQIYLIRQNDLCLLAPGVEHIDMFNRSTPVYRSLWFSYCPGLLHLSLFEYTPLGRWSVPKHGGFFCGTEIGPLLLSLQRETAPSEGFSADAVTGLQMQLLATLLRAVAPKNRMPEAPMAFGHVSSFVLRYLHEHYAEPLQLADVARAVHLSPHYVATRFRQDTGASIVEKLTEIRISQARHLLLELHLPIREVADAVGYRSVDHFSRMFRKVTGVSPGQFSNYSEKRRK